MVADLVQAIEHAESSDGTTFAGYLADAEEAFRESNKRVRSAARFFRQAKASLPR